MEGARRERAGAHEGAALLQPFDVDEQGKDEQSRVDYLYLQRTLKDVSGLDLGFYKERQMLRRLRGFASRQGMTSLRTLADEIRRDRELRQQLTDYLAINVTEFFRNPERYDELARTVLPAVLQRTDALRIWSAGCSTGAEPYSLAILLEEMGAGGPEKHRILGTDIDREALAEARRAIYTEERLKEVSRERLQRFFTRLPDGRWQVNERIRRYVSFSQHNLLEDRYPADQHLILCRNVIIYFTDEAKREIFARMAGSLVPGGYLLVGSTETIFYPGQYGLKSVAPFLYVREG